MQKTLVLLVACLAVSSAAPQWPFFHFYRFNPTPFFFPHFVQPPPIDPENWKLISDDGNGFVYIYSSDLPLAAPASDAVVVSDDVALSEKIDEPQTALIPPKEDIKTRFAEEDRQFEVKQKEIDLKVLPKSDEKVTKVVKKVPVFKDYPGFFPVFKTHQIYHFDTQKDEPHLTVTSIKLLDKK